MPATHTRTSPSTGRKAVVVDTAGFHLAVVTDAIAEQALARGEVSRTDRPGLFRLRDDADRLLHTPGLTPEQRRRQYVQKQKGKRR